MVQFNWPLKSGAHSMKKGRHRRFEEARALKQNNEVGVLEEPCAECGAEPEDEHASWCMATADLEEAEDPRP
jgi:hypothetical protein